MKIVRVRISGWSIRRGDRWMEKYSSASPRSHGWTLRQDFAYVFKRLSEAEQWIAKNS